MSSNSRFGEAIFNTIINHNDVGWVVFEWTHPDIASLGETPPTEFGFADVFHYEGYDRIVHGIIMWNATDGGPDGMFIGLWLNDELDGCPDEPELLAVWGECDTATGQFMDQGWMDFSNLEYYAQLEAV